MLPEVRVTKLAVRLPPPCVLLPRGCWPPGVLLPAAVRRYGGRYPDEDEPPRALLLLSTSAC